MIRVLAIFCWKVSYKVNKANKAVDVNPAETQKK